MTKPWLNCAARLRSNREIRPRCLSWLSLTWLSVVPVTLSRFSGKTSCRALRPLVNTHRLPFCWRSRAVWTKLRRWPGRLWRSIIVPSLVINSSLRFWSDCTKPKRLSANVSWQTNFRTRLRAGSAPFRGKRENHEHVCLPLSAAATLKGRSVYTVRADANIPLGFRHPSVHTLYHFVFCESLSPGCALVNIQ